MFRRSERAPRGQIVVIVALALTTLVAMVGVVVDGGMAWSNRRQVQNAADSASLAGARVLGLDVRWRATGSPNPPGAPFVGGADAAVCDAINNALGYNANPGQQIEPIACDVGSPDAVYVNFDGDAVGQVGDGIPLTAQGVRVVATGQSETMLMQVVGISSIDVGGDAMALAGPAEPPLGKLMPFVVQNPLGPFVPGSSYEIRSESEGECGALAPDLVQLAAAPANPGNIVLAMAIEPAHQDAALLAAKPITPVADPGSTTFLASIIVELESPTSGAKIYYTVDGSTPNSTTLEYKPTTVLEFTETTALKAVAIKGGESSDIGSFTYTKSEPPPDAVIATPGSSGFASTVDVSLTSTTGATIHYTTDGTDPTTSSPSYTTTLTFDVTTTLKAIAVKNLSSSPVSTYNYTKDGDTVPPSASPPGGTEFESGLTVTLSTPTPDATIHYTLDGTTPTTSSPAYTAGIVLTETTTINAFATAVSGDSAVVSFTYTKVGPTCPDSTAGNFGWVDFSGGAGGNNELKDWVDEPSTAPGNWYYNNCDTAGEINCRDQHNVPDSADDHWLLEGTTGHRDVTLDIACKYVGTEIYVPIWDSFETISKKPNGANAVFHLIGFGAFKLEGVIDIKPNGDPSGKGCGVQDIDGTSGANEKGFIGTYVDSFIGTQVARCIIDPATNNPCTNLNSNTAFTINLAE